MNEAVIVSAARTAVGRAHKGSLRTVRPDDMGAAVVTAVIDRAGIDANWVEDVIMGCAMPEAEQGMNMARIAALRAGLPHTVAGQTVNRFCSSGLQTIALAAQQIMSGMGEVLIAGGSESMSMVPMTGHVFAPNPDLLDISPEVYMSMGLTAENVAQRHNISRAEADEFALDSHQKAAAAQDAGKFANEIVPLDVAITEFGDDDGGKPLTRTNAFEFKTDESVRRDTNLEALAKLKPAFSAVGSVTAGNASPMSDGAAAVLLMSADKARQLGLKPLAKFISFAVGGVPPEVMGIGPTVAIPKALKLAGLNLADIDLFELNEAFAAQALAVIKTLGMDQRKVNVNGGAIALGHPLGCTGAKLTVSLINEMHRRNARYGMVTMCVGGGMGAAGIFERMM
jgi:acetyl-CoA acyltransferase